MSLPSFPPAVPWPGAPLPSTGSLGSVPRLLGTIEALRLPAARPASLRFLRSAVPRPRPSLRSRRWPGALAPAGLGCWSPVASAPAIARRRRQGLPGSWGTPVRVALLFDPGGTAAPGPCGASVLPSAHLNDVGSLDQSPFEAQSHGSRTRCLRFAAPGHPAHHARLASGWWPAFAGRDSHPLGSNERFRLPHGILPPFPGLAWRKVILGRLSCLRGCEVEGMSLCALDLNLASATCEVWTGCEVARGLIRGASTARPASGARARRRHSDRVP